MKRRLLLGCLCLLPVVASARLIPTPTYQDLHDRADAVVIATPQATTDTEEHIALPGLHPDVPATGVNTPLLLDFDRAVPQTLLFFLVRESDGRYAPVVGQTDPAGFSVFRIDRGL